MAEIKYIPVSKLWGHPDNPRKGLGDVTELAESIKVNGVLQNLTVVPLIGEITKKWDGESYRVIIGHRRLAAAKLAGLEELPCVVVEMSEREQLSTMLTENMQRSDLTVYEQAQGFQMMLNMGDSVAEIAEKSGFSQTTIRRRVKLLDLDRQKFQKAEARGATLNDYLELDKLDSPEDKNKALDAIGTANFNSVLKSLISEQEIQKKLAEWTEIADKFAYQIERSGEFNGTTVNMVYHAGYSRWDLKKEMTIPEDASDVRYFYRKDSTGITLYRERQQSQQPDPEAEAREERRRRDEQAENEFAEAAEAHFELRKDFIKELPNSVFKQHMKEISLFCVATTESIDGGYHYCIVSLGSHPCAYVEIPKDHPCYGLNYEKIKVSCHGGLTYSEKGIGPLFPDAFWIGWDYMHFGDRIELLSYGARGKTWTTREILTEVENVVYQLSGIGGKVGLFSIEEAAAAMEVNDV